MLSDRIAVAETHTLQHEYVSGVQLAAAPAAWWDGVLGVAGFDAPPPLERPGVPLAASMTPALDARAAVYEVWRIDAATPPAVSQASSSSPGVVYRHGGGWLFGSIALDEFTAGGLVAATREAYTDVFRVLAQTGYRHLIRVWNYLADINREMDGEERYRSFNAARQAAFRADGRATAGASVPAASALGSPAGSPLCIYFIASDHAPRMIENPRQTSAYHYPPKFGTSSPTFSRACVLEQPNGTHLFVSGTSSILGHETMHAGDVIAQTRESLANIEALIGESNRIVGARRYSLQNLKLKVYVRREADLAAIQSVVSAADPRQPVVYLRADVCRDDLSVEIEATGHSPGT